MAREATGTTRWRNCKAYARVSLGAAGRLTIPLPTCKTPEQADERTALLGSLAKVLRDAGATEHAPKLLKDAGSRDGKALDAIVKAIDAIGAGRVVAKKTNAVTFKKFAEQWTSGDLARDYPAHVREKRTAETDGYRLSTHVYGVVGDVPIVAFSLDHALEVMRRLPASLEPTSRRHVAQVIGRVLNLAVFPCRIIPATPLPKGWLPQLGPEKAKSALYPSEDLQHLRCAAVPLGYRVLVGFLNREGMRKSEAKRLAWAHLDLDRGMIRLDKNKTDRPRAWPLSPGVAAALKAWRKRTGGEAGDPVFVHEDGSALDWGHLADRLREQLVEAGVDRPELFERSETRIALRAHDLRATFITIGLANGKTESWIIARTGHRSSAQIQAYHRAAETFAELNLGGLAPLVEAVPELAPTPSDASPPTGPESDPADPSGRDGARASENPAETGTLATSQDAGGDCGSSRRGFNPRYSPQASEALKASGSESAERAAGEPQQETRALMGPVDAEAALAMAIGKAAEAGAFDAVLALTAELRARRLAREGVADLAAARAARKG